MNKKLLITMGGMGFGGAERVISLIANDFAERGWEVWIALLLNDNVAYRLHESVHIVDLTFGGGSRLRRLPGWLLGIRRLTRQLKPDAVLSFIARVNVITQLACLGLHRKIVVSERNDPYMDGRSKGVDFLTNLLYPGAKAVVFQTVRASGYFKKIKLRNSCIIANPITVRAERRPCVPGKIVTAGRLAPQKNHKLLIEAFCSVAGEFPEAELTIYGEGDLREELAQLIADRHMEQRIHLPGSVTDIHQRICDAAAFVMSSDYEGLSNALLEAMMIGLPCISTDCAGSDEYIENGVNGCLIPVGDTQALSDALRTFLADPQAAEEMGARGRLSVADLEKSRILERWFKVITE